ncbi:MAG: hypothetical protein JXR96_21810 [Deltaproteobacteria bacterium]|nr:hypothetical protein [Deltaproteobacteria bacterium]
MRARTIPRPAQTRAPRTGARRLAAWAIFMGLLAMPAPAAPLPPERVVCLEVGQDHFIRGWRGDWIASSDHPERVEVRAFEHGEVHLLARAAGKALIVLYSAELRNASIFEVRIGPSAIEPAKPDPGDVRAACGCEQREKRWHCKVEHMRCIEAMRIFLERSDIQADDLRLQYDVAGLQALLRDLEKRVRAAGFEGVELAFEGVRLRLGGRIEDEAAFRKLLLVLYRGMVGKLLIDDRLERKR